MIRSLTTSGTLGIACSILLFATASISSAVEEHPMMHAASESLRAAQTSADPINDLKNALQRLRGARDNKAGYRVEAMRLVTDAIAALQAGNRIDANKSITQAINAIERGIALHPRDNRPKRRK